MSACYKASSSLLASFGNLIGSLALRLMKSTKSETSRPPSYFSGLSLLFFGAQYIVGKLKKMKCTIYKILQYNFVYAIFDETHVHQFAKQLVQTY